MGGVPGGVEDDDSVGGHQVDAKTSGLRRDQEEPGALVRFLSGAKLETYRLVLGIPITQNLSQ